MKTYILKRGGICLQEIQKEDLDKSTVVRSWAEKYDFWKVKRIPEDRNSPTPQYLLSGQEEEGLIRIAHLLCRRGRPDLCERVLYSIGREDYLNEFYGRYNTETDIFNLHGKGDIRPFRDEKPRFGRGYSVYQLIYDLAEDKSEVYVDLDEYQRVSGRKVKDPNSPGDWFKVAGVIGNKEKANLSLRCGPKTFCIIHCSTLNVPEILVQVSSKVSRKFKCVKDERFVVSRIKGSQGRWIYALDLTKLPLFNMKDQKNYTPKQIVGTAVKLFEVRALCEYYRLLDKYQNPSSPKAPENNEPPKKTEFLGREETGKEYSVKITVNERSLLTAAAYIASSGKSARPLQERLTVMQEIIDKYSRVSWDEAKKMRKLLVEHQRNQIFHTIMKYSRIASLSGTGIMGKGRKVSVKVKEYFKS